MRAKGLLTRSAIGLCLAGLVCAGEKAREAPRGPRNRILAPLPLEISGVAAIPGGYLVVGDEQAHHARIWPAGGTWVFPKPVPDAEAVDVGYGPRGQQLWLVLSEAKRMLVDQTGASWKAGELYAEIDKRGLEGLAVRWKDGWEVALLWEGGFVRGKQGGRWLNPRVIVLTWVAGKGVAEVKRRFELKVPRLEADQGFRAPDLVWQGPDLLVLLASSTKRSAPYRKTWIQRFRVADGEPVGKPLKLEESWGPYRQGKNWEAMDWSLDGRYLVLGYDSKSDKPARHLALLRWNRHSG